MGEQYQTQDRRVSLHVLVVDDHPIVRQGLAAVIRAQPDLEVVGEATNGDEAVMIAVAKQPDVIILDLHMPIKDGLTVIHELRQVVPHGVVLVLTSVVDHEKILAALQAGASGYMLKDAPTNELLAAIRAVAQGDSALHPSVARLLVNQMQQPVTAVVSHDVTAREQDVLRLIARGHTNQEIADYLGLSIRTVTTHVRNILDKLHLDNRTQAALYARDHGLA